jgi:protein-S-isoprenylcysteine O-methyltransferase Ste14
MKVDMKLLVGQTVGLFVIVALALFLPAGTISWLVGWAYLALFFGFFMGVNFWLLRHNPGLLQERLHFRTSDQKGWDKVVFPMLGAFPAVWLAFISLDANRYHWSPVPLWVQVIGGILLVLSFYIFFLTFRENSYLSPVVRIQEERGHAVVSTGPYHLVRHPMYSGIVIFMIATPLLLGSWYGVLVGLLLVVLLARRAMLEERTLRQELRGYPEYMSQVKYRFIPYIW